MTGESDVMVKVRPPSDAEEGSDVRTADCVEGSDAALALGGGGSDCVLEPEGIRGEALAMADCAARLAPELIRVALPLLARVPFGAGVV